MSWPASPVFTVSARSTSMLLGVLSANGVCSLPPAQEHLSPLKANATFRDIDPHRSVKNDEHFVGIGMPVPDKVALKFTRFELAAIAAG